MLAQHGLVFADTTADMISELPQQSAALPPP